MNLIRVFIFGVFCLSFNTSLLNAAENKTVVETELWNLIADFGSMDDYKRYLSNYPNGYYAKKAKRKMAFILKQQGSSSRKIEPIKIIVQKTQKKIIKKKKIRKNGKAVLTINTSPSSAKIRILNIGPRYSKGLELKPGRYHVDVSKSGYKSIRKWVVLGKEDKTISIALKK